MSKKEYVEIARILHEAYHREELTDKVLALNFITSQFVHYCKKENQRFDADKFRKAVWFEK